MDDEDIYGKEFYRLNFSKAVEQKLLSDYKVLILTVREDTIDDSLRNKLKQFGGDIELDLSDAIKLIGCWRGLAGEIMPEDDVAEEVKKSLKPLHRAVAFTSLIKESKAFQQHFPTLIEEYLKTQEGLTQLHCKVEHVDGTQGAMERSKNIAWLKATPEKNECRILSNARCLCEGVDVPALDAVIFLQPKQSKVDIIQSVGRVMRAVKGKDYGYIILPVVIPPNQSADAALDNNERFQIVWNVLQAIRAHDDRFNIEINKIALDKTPEHIVVPPPMNIGGNKTAIQSGDADTPENPEKKSKDKNEKNDKPPEKQPEFNFDDKEFADAIYAKIVKKCGDKGYLEDWARIVADVANKYIDKLKYLADTDEHKPKFASLLDTLRENINANIDEQQAIELLAQHIVTKPIFDALFGSSEFSRNNPVSIGLDTAIGLLEDAQVDTLGGIKSLDNVYADIRNRIAGVKSSEGRQMVINNLYEKFFKNAFPKVSEQLGIVYTPIEVVDFILHSVDYILRKEFGGGFDAKGNDILDPFTGTGTFIVRLLKSGLISPKNLRHEYENEIHANEIVLLAYYIAAINIGNTFRECIENIGGSASAPLNKTENNHFPGIVWTDTFAMKLPEDADINENLPLFENKKRRKKQSRRIVKVIIGNPPYSAGQKSANDNNQNQKYPELDERVRQTYVETSTATNKNSLYDSYIKAFRWASDRIGDRGVIAFVSNGGWLDGNAMDGFRKALDKEFDDIYLFNCRGNARTSGETRRKEGGNFFGSGSRAPIVITVLVKKGK
ncbi:MAG: N-6 DNA methylase [Planctomycetaceae bacterium]|jgi:predicted helicase|nr:N-6 DNA methylase [Planctomycetaceae bacterium]